MVCPPFRPPDAEATQALGICFTADRRIVLVTANGEDWTLPGGAPELGETLEQALAREVGEEACARVVGSCYIGCQRVEELDTDRVAYYQARFWARIELDEFTPEHEMTARRLVLPQEFLGELFWGAEKSAGLILDRGLAVEKNLRDRGDRLVGAVEIVDYDPTWPGLFAELGARLRRALGDLALRIDHIGSTAVPGLAAKPVIDVQVSVANLEPLEAYRAPLEDLGFVYRANNTERTKRYFREPAGHRRTHIHVRRAGSFSEQFPLLFRDHLREHQAEASRYAAKKRRLAASYESAACCQPSPWQLMQSRQNAALAGMSQRP